MEIAEEAEEDQRSKRQSTVQEERPPTAKETKLDSDGTFPLTNTRSLDVDTNRKLPTTENPPLSPTEARRLSSQSVRPHMYTLSSYGTSNKPKIKLGPRPSLDHKAQSDSDYRPVASMPAGLKIFRRGSKKQKSRPQSSEQSTSTSSTAHRTGLSEMRDAIRPHTSGGRPTTSSGVSVRDGNTGPPLPGLGRSNSIRSTSSTMTPEKARLMKALQLRKKQMSSRNSTSPETTGESSPEHKEPAESGTNGSSNTADIDCGSGNTSGYTSNDFCSELTKTDSSPTSPVNTEHAASTKASSLSESTEETVQEYQKEQLPGDEVIPENVAESEIGDADLHSLSAVAEDEAGELEDRLEDLEGKSRETASEEVPEGKTPKDEIAPVQPATDMTESSERSSSQDVPVSDQIKETIVETEPNLDVEGEQKDAEVSRTIDEVPQTPRVEPPTPKSPSPHSDFPNEEKVDSKVPAEKDLPTEQNVSSENEPLKEDKSENSNLSLTPSRDLKIPTSKFSTSDLSDTNSAADKQDLSLDQPPPVPDKTNLLEDGSLKHRRKSSHVIRTDISAANSDSEFLEDDDLMDELQSATVQEAKPVSVAKSPMSLTFPVSPTRRTSELNRNSRVFSNPILQGEARNKGLNPPEKVQVGRSVSAGNAYLDRINQQQTATLVKKVNVGTGISQRIKALEKFSSASPSPGTLPSTTGNASPAFFSVRQSSIRRAKSPTIADRANSFTQSSNISLSPTPSFSPEGTPELGPGGFRDRANSIQSRKEVFNAGLSTRPATARPESISVTARIIRDGNQWTEANKDHSEYGPIDLKSSPLTIDHQKAVPASTSKPTIQERRSSKEMKIDRRSSITIVKDLLSSPRRSSFSSSGRRSVNLEAPEPSPRPETSASSSSRRSSPKNGAAGRLSPSTSNTSDNSTSPNSKPPLSGGHPKSEGRGMKMLRRMSSGFSNGRKTLSNAISPTHREGTITEPKAKAATPAPSMTTTDIGDVNVQFPDTLLWKRRHLLLDSQGFLVLSASQSQSGIAATTKRYHMSEVTRPMIPDVDMQELPNSVALEFHSGGGGLQFACEDRGGQRRVLECEFFPF